MIPPRTLYNFNHKVMTFGSSTVLPSLLATISCPKCLQSFGSVQPTRCRSTGHLLVYQTRRGQLRAESKSEDLAEPTLVVIEALFTFIVNTSNIYHDGTGIKDGRISGALEVYGREDKL